MNDVENGPPKPEQAALLVPASDPFLQRNDWACFSITTLMMLTVYLFTMNPSIDLDESGIYTTGAMYLGVPNCPGYPVWNVYAYLFTALFRISNAAWRVSLAAAVASAFTCGIVTLVTSRFSRFVLGDLTGRRWLHSADGKKLSTVCACVAGLMLGFDGAFWDRALIADPWNFSVLLFSITLVLLMRWGHAPEQMRWFYAACFMFGLSVCDSQELAPAGVGICCWIVCTKPALARDVFFVTVLLIGILLVWDRSQNVLTITGNLLSVFLVIGILLLIITVVVAVVSRSFFVHWRAAFVGPLAFLAGLVPNFLLPVFSAANPPMNWGYPRTVDGFYHLVSRGQYERVYPADSFARYGESLSCYFADTQKHFGVLYLCVALIPFCFVWRFQKMQRRWLCGMFGMLMSVSLFMVYLLNPSTDRASEDMHAHFFTPSHLIFSILLGCGLAIAGLFLSGSRPDSAAA